MDKNIEENCGSERRKSERLGIDAPVKIYFLDKEQADANERILKNYIINKDFSVFKKSVDGQIINLSPGSSLIGEKIKDLGTGGELVKTSEDLDEGGIVILHFEVPFKQIKEEFYVKAKVVRSVKKGECYETGISFVSLILHYTENSDFDDINLLLNL